MVAAVRTPVLLLSATLGIGAAQLPPASAQGFGPEFQVNTYTTNGQYQPSIAVDAAGRFVVVWESYGQDDAFGSIVARRFGPNGGPVGGELVVSSSASEARYTPTVAADADGGFVVVWVDGSDDGSYSDVRARRYSADGVPAGAEFQVNEFTTGWQSAPVVAFGAANDFVVVWRSDEQDGSGYGIFARRFDSGGAPAGDELQVNVTRTGSQNLPAVAADAAGSFLVVWQSDDGDGTGIVGRRLDTAGAPVAGELAINEFTSGDQSDPAVAPGKAGSWVVVWSSDGQDGSRSGIFGRRLEATGTALGGEFAVNVTTAENQDEPAIASEAAGDFVVTWESYRLRDSGYDILGRRFDAEGSPSGGELVVNAHTEEWQCHPAVASRPAGRFLVAWQSHGQDGWGSGIFARCGGPWLFVDDFESGDVCGWSASPGGGCV